MSAKQAEQGSRSGAWVDARGDQLMYVMHPSSKLRLVQTGARHVTGAALIEQTNQFNCNRLITRTTASIELQRRYRYQ